MKHKEEENGFIPNPANQSESFEKKGTWDCKNLSYHPDAKKGKENAPKQ